MIEVNKTKRRQTSWNYIWRVFKKRLENLLAVPAITRKSGILERVIMSYFWNDGLGPRDLP